MAAALCCRSQLTVMRSAGARLLAGIGSPGIVGKGQRSPSGRFKTAATLSECHLPRQAQTGTGAGFTAAPTGGVRGHPAVQPIGPEAGQVGNQTGRNAPAAEAQPRTPAEVVGRWPEVALRAEILRRRTHAQRSRNVRKAAGEPATPVTCAMSSTCGRSCGPHSVERPYSHFAGTWPSEMCQSQAGPR